MGNIKNISTAQSRAAYSEIVSQIANKYPDYNIVVNGGGYRGYCVRYEVDKDTKTITIDYYLPKYIHSKRCNRWVIGEIEKGNTCGSAGLGMRKAVLCLTGAEVYLTPFDRKA